MHVPDRTRSSHSSLMHFTAFGNTNIMDFQLPSMLLSGHCFEEDGSRRVQILN